MDVFGSFTLLLAFACAVYAFVGGIGAIITRHPLLVKSTRQAGIATCVLIFIGTFSLEYLLFSDNFSQAYVVSHSNRDLSTFYKFAALWSGQEGSLLFWSFLLAVYVISVLIAYRHKNGELMPYVGVILAGVQIFFLTLNNFVESPFKILAAANANGVLEPFVRQDGNGLTGLLQYPEMVIHPPNLYAGYTGFTIPFAFALAALLARYPGEKWIHLTRKWTMIAWCFQSVGILLGAHWAYAVLGWGGYWGWDPVENASLLPWLTGTAFLHSVMMQEKRGMMKVWNVWLVFSTFLMCILGHFPHAQRRGEFGARVRKLADRAVVCRLHGIDAGGVFRRVREESRLLEERESARLLDFARVQLPVQQFAVPGGVHRGSLRHAFPRLYGVVHAVTHQRWRAVLQQDHDSHRAGDFVSDGRGAAACLAQDID